MLNIETQHVTVIFHILLIIETRFQPKFLHTEPLRHGINVNPQFGCDHVICCDRQEGNPQALI